MRHSTPSPTAALAPSRTPGLTPAPTESSRTPFQRPQPLARRQVLAAALSLPLLGAMRRAYAQDTTIRIAQSTALTGPLGDLGSAMHQGAKAAFGAINTRGGIHGKTIELVTQDDAYEVP